MLVLPIAHKIGKLCKGFQGSDVHKEMIPLELQYCQLHTVIRVFTSLNNDNLYL